MKRYQHHRSSGKYTRKPPWGATRRLLEWRRQENVQELTLREGTDTWLSRRACLWPSVLPLSVPPSGRNTHTHTTPCTLAFKAASLVMDPNKKQTVLCPSAGRRVDKLRSVHTTEDWTLIRANELPTQSGLSAGAAAWETSRAPEATRCTRANLQDERRSVVARGCRWGHERITGERGGSRPVP